MSYTALYRKFRPASFADVRGQDAIVTTLKNQIRAKRIGHAYLFCGTRGTGKTTIAKILAKAVNCENPQEGDPCGVCPSCQAIAQGRAMNVIEIDAASNNGVENIREIREEVTYTPSEGNYKVYIIDEVHMLSIGAFNALLKTLEEPPSYVIFILATTEANKIPITILSRCQRYDFRRISQDTILDRLKDLMQQEGVDAEERALRYVAKKGDGSMRDALSLLDQCIGFYLGETLTYDKVLEVLGAVDTEVYSDMLRRMQAEDIVSLIKTLEQLLMKGCDPGQFVNDFTWYLRNLMLLKASDEMEDVLDVSTENLIQLREEAAMFREDTLMRYIRIFSELAGSIRYAANKRVLLEMTLIKACHPESERDEISLVERIRRLERKLEQGIVVPQGAVRPLAGSFEKAEAEQALAENRVQPSLEEAEEWTQTGDGQQTASYQGAVPEDLKKVRAFWKSILSETKGRFKVVLSAAKLKFNQNHPEDGKLYVVFADFLAERYLDDRESKKELEQIIAEKTGKHLEVRFVLAADEGISQTPLGTIEIDERIRENIHIDIEIEDKN